MLLLQMTTSFTAPILRALRLENIIDMKIEMLEFIADEMARVQPHSEGNYMERFKAEASKAMPGSRLEHRVNEVLCYTSIQILELFHNALLLSVQKLRIFSIDCSCKIYPRRLLLLHV